MSAEALGEMFVRIVGEDSRFQKMLVNAERMTGRARDELGSYIKKRTELAAVKVAAPVVAGQLDKPRDELGRYIGLTKKAGRSGTTAFASVGKSIRGLGLAAVSKTLSGFSSIFTRIKSRGTQAFNALKSSISKMGSMASHTFNRIKLGVGGVLVAMLALGGASSKMAADAAEVDNMFDVVFGQKSAEAKKQLEAFGAQVGRSAVDLKTMAAGAQGLFVPLGMARDQAAELSLSLTNLATDIGSFFNAADTDVMENLQSALIGNHEAIRKYGVMISEASLNQKLMNMGIKGGTEAASEQQKVLARLAIIYDTTKDAQGDATRTADSHSNTMKAFYAVVKDLSIKIGDALNPSIKAMVVYLKEGVNWAQAHSDTIAAWGQSLANVTSKVLEFVGYATAVVLNFGLAWETLKLTVEKAYVGMVSPIKDWADTSTQWVMWFFDNFTDLASASLEYIWQLFKNTGNFIVDFWKQTWDAVKSMDPSKFNPDTGKLGENLNKFDKIKGPDIQERNKADEDFSKRELEIANRWAEAMKKEEQVIGEQKKDAQMAMPNLQKLIENAGEAKKKDAKLDIVGASEIFRKRLSEQFENKEGKEQVKLLEKQVQMAEKNEKAEDERHKELVKAVKAQSPVGE